MRWPTPRMQAPRQAVELVLKAHEPYPALAVDRHWKMVAHNRMVPLLLAGLPPELLAPPLNVLRLSLHPQGLAPRIVNLAQWRAHLLHRLRQQVQASGDPVLAALARRAARLPGRRAASSRTRRRPTAASTCRCSCASPAGVLNFISTITVFGTPTDITLSELALETFFPADAAHGARTLRQLAETLR